MSRRVVYDGWGPMRAMAEENRPRRDQRDEPVETGEGYAILIQRYEGQSRWNQSTELVRRLSREAGINDTWIKDTGVTTVVLRGRYPAPDVDQAAADLAQIRKLKLDGVPSFATAQLVPLANPTGKANAISEWDVAQYAGMYTLQIGFYDEHYGKNFRKAAEEQVRKLRGEGEQAYYYHGPNRSLVTLELFSDEDFVLQGQQWAYGPRIIELQKRYPHNLGDGRKIIDMVDGKPQEQRSFLVEVR
ncbi:MAG: hypothetical protein WD042_14665 [Phycisphaeraceae bacterium]